ncbi:MAG: hypothetical protein RL122_2868 [Pseudomonadota bacterium]|jgi:hypothetical protein|uniref:ATP-binding protein n=1 Tax=Thiothrix fructosivorans TaxID=111770 RepID=A0A8B0SM75_9GAMM|nr:ATP-binding protein [Thiothrix fructosivorans]MBO0612534.1 ATP-binding protein [Thiothrix fructosivorans]QTX11989.1 ATP-binding protein [Thiothrix fructosivorans]
MTRIFIRDEYHCGQHDISAEDYVNQFEAPRLFGRTHEIGLLNQAWTNPQARLFLLHGETGGGKTALIHKWLHHLQKKHWHDAEAVFLWSFYPPDLAHIPQDPVEEFFRHALYWFGGETASRCPNLLQGEHLARLMQAHHTLLILDGLDILQFKTGSNLHQLGDPRLNVLIERLSAGKTGLCIALSREPLQGRFDETQTQRHALDKLSVDASAEYLSYKGVQAEADKLRQIAVDYGQNPLTLGLLGGYLNVWHNGDWKQMEKIPVLMDQQADGRQARRILVANSAELQHQPSEAILYLLSMLYRPIHWDALETLLGKAQGWGLFHKKQQDNYASLISSFARLNQKKRYLAILQLRELGLLELSGRYFWLPQWVREAYQRQLRFDWPQAWKETTQRLMQYHANLPKVDADLSSIAPLSETQPSVKINAPFGRIITPTVPETVEAIIPDIITEIRAEPIPESLINLALTLLPEPDTQEEQPIVELPALSPVTPVTALPPRHTVTRADLDNLIDLSTKLKQYQNSLQMLDIRTKKYQKHVRQLDKDVQSMHYPPARTGTASR